MDFAARADPMGGAGASPYMKDLVEKLAFVKTEVLSQYHVPDVSEQWVSSTVRFAIRTFVLHASIAKPLGESGKLQLTTDMTELEFALSAFMSGGGGGGGDKGQSARRGADWDSVGADYRALRAMRCVLRSSCLSGLRPRFLRGRIFLPAGNYFSWRTLRWRRRSTPLAFRHSSCCTISSYARP